MRASQTRWLAGTLSSELRDHPRINEAAENITLTTACAKPRQIQRRVLIAEIGDAQIEVELTGCINAKAQVVIGDNRIQLLIRIIGIGRRVAV